MQRFLKKFWIKVELTMVIFITKTISFTSLAEACFMRSTNVFIRQIKVRIRRKVINWRRKHSAARS